METEKVLFKVWNLFRQWKKADDPMTRFDILNEIDRLLNGELARCSSQTLPSSN